MGTPTTAKHVYLFKHHKLNIMYSTDYSKQKSKAGWELFRDLVWLIVSLALSAFAVKQAYLSHYDAATFFLLCGYIVFPYQFKKTL